ncbi:FAD/NAD(P)-binding domain-containing protein [Fusarium austroafricanum]|uniref:FAD/NAD(P)-binding domain-containing protein n=1 Tax=Fusarium austroafricanum TaxID=2364996 RepID=A0A8H4KI69_9HYPO|nr:FAD/NAD(P)-binding domain-containing protein [Fusarium austroafricanum]
MPIFDIVVVGGVLFGLGTFITFARQGHKVPVLEASPSLQIVGDAIACIANHARVLEGWGLLDRFRQVAPRDLGIMHHRCFSNAEISLVKTWTIFLPRLDIPSYILSRQGYQQFLYDEAVKLGVIVSLNNRVGKVDDNQDQPEITLTDGSRHQADLIVGRDECTSQTNCYRAVLTREQVAQDPDLKEFTETMNFWMAPNRLIIQSVMAGIGSVAINLYHPGHGGTAGSWKSSGDVNQMREDAAHAMAPYVEQGCAVVMEDVATLAECVARVKATNDLPQLLRTCEDIRRPRSELISRTAAIVGKIWQIPDGPGQERHDERMRQAPLYSAAS